MILGKGPKAFSTHAKQRGKKRAMYIDLVIISDIFPSDLLFHNLGLGRVVLAQI